jgi:hypothetical protein
MKYVLIVYLLEPVDTNFFSRNWSKEKFESKQSQSDLVYKLYRMEYKKQRQKKR